MAIKSAIRVASPRALSDAVFSAMFPHRRMSYNPECDRQECEQTGGVDLRKAVATNTIPGDASDNLLPANCVGDPGLLLPRPKDQFERMRQLDFVHEHLKDSTDEIQRALAEKALDGPNPDAAAAAAQTQFE